ncbi:MAG: glycosyltransferase family 2 protein [Desulfosarcina sp.]|nr:glycosyltransferase family 2 protein [Desulfosarcina sp.]
MYLISVIICTYNRANILSETLESWLSIQNAGPDVELIIVDNNSTDRTLQVVESFRPSCPSRLYYVCEKNAGLSNARNRGIEESSGDIVAFVDDDIYFEKSWLNEILKAFDDNPEISCVGGKSVPKFEAAIPDWITEDIHKQYGSTGSGKQDRLMIFPEHPFGLNMAFRKYVFSQVGNFNPILGRVKGCLLSNEELDIFYRVKKANLLVYYASKAILYHRIPRDRVDKSWLLKRYYWQGISDVIADQIFNQRSKYFFCKKAVGILRQLIFPLGIISPLKNFKYYISISFRNKLLTYKLFGMLKQYIFMFFSL